MNKLNQMNVADLSSQEVEALQKYEKDINSRHQNNEIYLIAFRK